MGVTDRNTGWPPILVTPKMAIKAIKLQNVNNRLKYIPIAKI